MTANTYVQQYAPVPTALDALPTLPREFTGRADDLAFILGVLDPDGRDDGPAVAVLSGWGGVGKTTLAYAAGHAAQRRGWFTGVLLVDLHGYDPHPAQAADALEALLRSLGVRPEHLPPPGANREALYRSQLNARQETGERLLVIADNASAVGQVQPLLPPGHHGMLITSRHSLTGLGRLRTVNHLQPEDAVALLEAALKSNDPGDVRVEEDPGAAERVALACGCLPLALQITAALLAQDPGQPLSERADALSRTEGVLDGLNDGERSLRAMFDQSLDRLLPQEQDLFRLLSLNPGPDISTPAAAVLADQPQPATERLLGRLAASHLIERNPAVRGRWQMHDLLRAYAHEQAEAVMARGRVPRRRYDQARDRLIDHYIQHAEAANTYLLPPGSSASSRFTVREEALAWFDSERENLIATAHATPHAGLDLGFALGRYLEWRRRLQDLVVVRSLALDACRTLNDTRNEAGAWNNLGLTLKELRRFDEALHAHETARTLFQQTGNTHGEADAWNNLGLALRELRRFDEALHAHQIDLNHCQQTGNTQGAAGAWNNLGLALQELRRFDEAHDAHTTARTLFQQTGDTHSEATAWNNLGLALRELRRFDEAYDAHTTARTLYQQTGDTHSEATAWNNLGITLRELRRFDEAHDAHTTARTLFQQIGDTHSEADVWNNLGITYRGLERFDEAVDAGRRAASMLAQTQDWFRTGEAWGELATTLATAGTDPAGVREAWLESATAYTRADADEEAAASQAHADSTEFLKEQLPTRSCPPFRSEPSSGAGTGAGA
ncbi:MULTISPECIES: ATP-binding protein [unclassified Streptomyces]|uniref:ATP-binding protein n=1 Tax=unclassified Streptomyces TaxID=2593676 RepID=UPI001160E2D2|nr:tetratricopeptide repeat protein [Streptomyces sp. CB02058]